MCQSRRCVRVTGLRASQTQLHPRGGDGGHLKRRGCLSPVRHCSTHRAGTACLLTAVCRRFSAGAACMRCSTACTPAFSCTASPAPQPSTCTTTQQVRGCCRWRDIAMQSPPQAQFANRLPYRWHHCVQPGAARRGGGVLVQRGLRPARDRPRLPCQALVPHHLPRAGPQLCAGPQLGVCRCDGPDRAALCRPVPRHVRPCLARLPDHPAFSSPA